MSDEDNISREADAPESQLQQRLYSIGSGCPQFERSWEKAQQLLDTFKPVSWSVWRLISHTVGNSMKVNPPTVGMLRGYDSFLNALILDPYLGSEKLKKKLDYTEIITEIGPDVLAAGLFIHSVCRRLDNYPLRRIWSTMLDDALIRARLGFHLGSFHKDFGAGRGMLSGFSGRVGLIVLIATGTHKEAGQSLQLLAQEVPIQQVGLKIYHCSPLHVSAHMLLRAGVGLDAAVGVLSNGSTRFEITNSAQERWLASFRIIDQLRANKSGKISESEWLMFEDIDSDGKKEIRDIAQHTSRKGHSWNWITQQLKI